MNTKFTEAQVNSAKVLVWHPEKNEKGFVISMSDGGWLKGIYDSVESALMGAKHDLLMTPEFYDMQKRVNHIDRENRLITTLDFESFDKRGEHE